LRKFEKNITSRIFKPNKNYREDDIQAFIPQIYLFKSQFATHSKEKLIEKV